MLSIIIPTYKRKDFLITCLNALSEDRQKSIQAYEIIVSDDGRDESLKNNITADYPKAIYIHGPQKGPAANRNCGAAQAKGEWLIFIDDDCIPDETLINAYSEAILQHADVKVFEGKTYVNEPRKSLSQVSPLNTEGGYLWSCNFMIEASYFKKLGGFDEKFPYAAMEDVDLRTRIVNSGEKFLFIKNASVMHPWRNKGGWKKLMQHQEATWIYLSLHPDKKTEINARYYFEKTLRQFIKDTIPGIFKYKGRGMTSALLEHLTDMKMMFQLLFK